MVHDQAHPDVNLIWGAAFDESFKDEMQVTVIATGFEEGAAQAAIPNSAANSASSAASKAPASGAGNTAAGGVISERDKDFFDIMQIFNQKK